MLRKQWFFLIGIGLLVLGGSSALASEVQEEGSVYYLPIVAKPPTHLEDLQLAFQSYRDGNGEIYVMRGDGSGQTRLTDNPAADADPHWSPDGTRIAFHSYRDGNWEIYVMQADGSGQINLTNNVALDFCPAWSPDGAKIAFVSYRDNADPVNCSPCNTNIYVMNADGSGQTRLTNNPDSDRCPDWSPDGTQIAFNSDRDGTWGVFTMQADGSNQTRLTDFAFDGPKPLWSPDGERIAFAYSSLDGNIFTVRPANLEITQLTHFPREGLVVGVGRLDWSPNGAEILFSRTVVWTPGSMPEIYVIKTDGSESQPRDLGIGGNTAWSPDGARIVFNTRNYPVGVHAQIIVMNADGTQRLTLTATEHDNFQADWAPSMPAPP